MNYPFILSYLWHHCMSLPWKEERFKARRLPSNHSWSDWCQALRQARIRNVHLWMRLFHQNTAKHPEE